MAAQALSEQGIALMRQHAQHLTTTARLCEQLPQLSGVQQVFRAKPTIFWRASPTRQKCLKRCGIRALFCATKQNRLAGCLRISIGTREECERLIAALQALSVEQA